MLRIGQELGLSPQLVQRAMYELPELTAQPHWYDRYFGSSIFSVGRVVPAPGGGAEQLEPLHA